MAMGNNNLFMCLNPTCKKAARLGQYCSKACEKRHKPPKVRTKTKAKLI